MFNIFFLFLISFFFYHLFSFFLFFWNLKGKKSDYAFNPDCSDYNSCTFLKIFKEVCILYVHKTKSNLIYWVENSSFSMSCFVHVVFYQFPWRDKYIIQQKVNISFLLPFGTRQGQQQFTSGRASKNKSTLLGTFLLISIPPPLVRLSKL